LVTWNAEYFSIGYNFLKMAKQLLGFFLSLRCGLTA
jgi:hypothetical protein